jgi:hypothetical protein
MRPTRLFARKELDGVCTGVLSIATNPSPKTVIQGRVPLDRSLKNRIVDRGQRHIMDEHPEDPVRREKASMASFENPPAMRLP